MDLKLSVLRLHIQAFVFGRRVVTAKTLEIEPFCDGPSMGKKCCLK